MNESVFDYLDKFGERVTHKLMGVTGKGQNSGSVVYKQTRTYTRPKPDLEPRLHTSCKAKGLQEFQERLIFKANDLMADLTFEHNDLIIIIITAIRS